MGQNILVAAYELYGFGFPHTTTDKAHYQPDASGNITNIDCSMVVYQALLNAGYGSVLPNSLDSFNTHTFFTGTTIQANPNNFSIYNQSVVSG